MTVRSVSRFTELCACLGRLRARATSISTTKVINDGIMLKLCTQKKKELAAKRRRYNQAGNLSGGTRLYRANEGHCLLKQASLPNFTAMM